MKRLLSALLMAAVLLSFASCAGKAAVSTQQAPEKDAAKQELALAADVKTSHSAAMTISGLDIPESFETEYSGYTGGKLPYYWTIYFGEYCVSLMYIPEEILAYAKQTGEQKVPISALKATVMSVTGSGDNRSTKELQDCTVSVSAVKDALTFDFSLSEACDADLTKVTEYKVEAFSLGDYVTKTFKLKDVKAAAQNVNKPAARKLQVFIKDERTAEFRLTDPDLQALYQIGSNLYYHWEIQFGDCTVGTMSPDATGLVSVSIPKMNHEFTKGGQCVGAMIDGEKASEADFNFELSGKTMIWTVHYPEQFRTGKDYDAQPFDFSGFDTFTAAHYKIENNNRKDIYEDVYKASDVVYDNGKQQNYDIPAVPARFLSSGSDSTHFAPEATNYVIYERAISWGAVQTRLISLFSLNENGIIVAEAHKVVCASAKDAGLLVNGSEAEFTPPIDKSAIIKTNGNTIYVKGDAPFVSSSGIGYPPYLKGKELTELKENCVDGYCTVDGETVYISKP